MQQLISDNINSNSFQAVVPSPPVRTISHHTLVNSPNASLLSTPASMTGSLAVVSPDAMRSGTSYDVRSDTSFGDEVQSANQTPALPKGKLIDAVSTQVNFTFQQGSVQASNDSSIYVLSEDASMLVTVPWLSILTELYQNENLISAMLTSMESQPNLRTKALQILNRNQPANPPFQSMQNPHFSDFTISSAIQCSETPVTYPLFQSSSTVDLSNNAMPGTAGITGWDAVCQQKTTSSPSSQAATSGSARTAALQSPGGNLSPTARPPTAFDLPPMPFPDFSGSIQNAPDQSSGANIIGVSYPSVVTADLDSIDPMIMAERPHNPTQREYIWSHASYELYEVDTPEGLIAQQESGTIRMVFPPGTMLLAHDTDGAEASPAWTARRANMKDSNEWLKAQVCHHLCLQYKAGTRRLNRPRTIRDHFQKCVWLPPNHPLKVLSTLQLKVLDLRQNGLIPTKSRTRSIHMGYARPIGGLQTGGLGSNLASPFASPFIENSITSASNYTMQFRTNNQSTFPTLASPLVNVASGPSGHTHIHKKRKSEHSDSPLSSPYSDSSE